MDLRVLSGSLALFILMALNSVPVTQGQAYHFSNGWFPGRKRSASELYTSENNFDSPLVADGAYRNRDSSASSSSAQLSSSPLGESPLSSPYISSSSSSSHLPASCVVRPQVQQLVVDLIQSEVTRMVSECRLPVGDKEDLVDASSLKDERDERPTSGRHGDNTPLGNFRLQDLGKLIERLRHLHDNINDDS